MLRRIALSATTLVLALSVTSIALPAAPRGATSDAGEQIGSARKSRTSVSLHQLLRGRVGWTLQLSRALRSLEQPPVTVAPGYGTRTIIDEPDPLGAHDGTPVAGDEAEDGERRRQEHEDGANESGEGTEAYKELG